MRSPTFSAGFMLAMNLALGQAAQTPITGSGGAVKPDASWFPPESAFRKVVLDEDAVVDGKATDTIVDPMELAVAKDGRVFWAERKGIVKMWSPSTKATVVIATIPVFDGLEDDVLVQVASRMRRPNLAEVMGRMEPTRARELTQLLADRARPPTNGNELLSRARGTTPAAAP